MVDGIESARLKLARATEHIDAIKSCVAVYAEREPYEVVLETNDKETVNVIEPPPSEIAILAGEAVYQIRSTLDHLAFDLVKFNCSNIALPINWFECCEFPLRVRSPKDDVLPRPQSEFERVLPGIPAKLYTLIEGWQPYNRNPVGNRLRLLAELSNIDKHRYLNLTVTRLSHREAISAGNQSYTQVKSLNDGAELEPLPIYTQETDGVNVERSITAFVSFDEPTLGGATSMPVEDVLELCLEPPQTIIVPSFEEFFDELS